LEVHSTTEFPILTHKKKPGIKYNVDTSDESVLDEEWKPRKNRRKDSKQRKAHSAMVRCKSLSRSIKTGSVTVA
jgi:hypothetical protein